MLVSFKIYLSVQKDILVDSGLVGSSTVSLSVCSWNVTPVTTLCPLHIFFPALIPHPPICTLTLCVSHQLSHWKASPSTFPLEGYMIQQWHFRVFSVYDVTFPEPFAFKMISNSVIKTLSVRGISRIHHFREGFFFRVGPFPVILKSDI